MSMNLGVHGHRLQFLCGLGAGACGRRRTPRSGLGAAVDSRALSAQHCWGAGPPGEVHEHPCRSETRLTSRVPWLSLIHISEPTRLGMISYAVFCLKKKKKTHSNT